MNAAATMAATTEHYNRNQDHAGAETTGAGERLLTAVTTSSGSVAERYAYTAYGQQTILDGSGSVLSSYSINNRDTYTGREWDQTLGLYHFRARWMSGLAGRFMGRDPIGFNGSRFNLHSIANGRVLASAAPSGEQGISFEKGQGDSCIAFHSCSGRIVSGWIGSEGSDINFVEISGWQFEGDCGCLADPDSIFRLDRGRIPLSVASAECKTQDPFEVLKRKKGDIPTCGCGLSCKPRQDNVGSFSIIEYQPLNEDYTFTVYVGGTFSRGPRCIVRSVPWKPNHEPCKVTIPKSTRFITTWFLMSFRFKEGVCEKDGN